LLFLIGFGVIIFALYLLLRRTSALEKQIEVQQQGQTTERFTRAIEQLSTYKMEVQLGGIFALERIARESEEEHWTVMEILTAYLRENAMWNSNEAYANNGNSDLNQAEPVSAKPLSDVQAIMTVLGRRSWTEKEVEFGKFLNLRKTNLRYLDLRGVNLVGANLRGVNLEGANLMEADLSHAFLGEANLKSANLARANLQSANLIGANLCDANLREVNVDSANLTGANLKGAFLVEANLETATFTSEDLEEANLEEA
jgi:uncharacterized protein YjbI with pentapeptide repeats